MTDFRGSDIAHACTNAGNEAVVSKRERMTDRAPFSLSRNWGAIIGRRTPSFSENRPAAFASSPLSLRMNVSWAFVGFATYAASQWVTLAIVARFCGPDGLGKFALALATSAPVMLFAGLELRLVQSADAEQKFSFAEYLALRLLGIGVAQTLIAGIGFVCGYHHLESSILMAVAFSKGTEAIADVFYGQFQQRERMDLIARSLILRSMISTFVFGFVMFVTGSLVAGIYAQSIVWMVILFAFDIPSARQFLDTTWSGLIRSRIVSSRIWALAILAAPAGLRSMLVSFEANIPYYALQCFSDERAIGVFAAMAYSLMIVQTFARSLNQPAVPRFAVLLSQHDHAAFAKLLWRLCGIGLAIGLVGLTATAVFGKLFLTLAYGAAFSRESDILVILMAACGLRMVSLPVAAAMTAASQFVGLFRIQAAAVAAMVVSAILFVPSLGLLGAALSALFVSLVMLIAHLLAVKTLLRS